MDVLISVIVPVYKVEKYLDRCVESIIAQSYNALEIILVDDGSPDCCGQKCDLWAVKDSRIKVLHKANGGLSDARNAGIRAAAGEYIIFVDSDDYIAPEMIARLYQAAVHAKAPMAICDVCCIDDAGVPAGKSEDSPLRDEILTAEQILPRFYQEKGLFYIVAWNKLYHRSLLDDETFPVGKWHEDEFVAAQLIWRAERVACIEYPGYYYVTQREGSIMNIRNDIRHLDALEALLIRYRFYQEIGQTALLRETRARVLTALECYYWNNPGTDAVYHSKMEQFRSAYESLSGLSKKEWLRWKVFQFSPALEKKLLEAMNKRS